MATLKCPKCSEEVDRLHRYNSGDQWMCPSCYVGMYCHPTPQTQWPEQVDNVLKDDTFNQCVYCGHYDFGHFHWCNRPSKIN